MDTLMGFGMFIWIIAIVIVSFCLFISPLMIWKHTKATSNKLDKIIALLSAKR
jgi:uncharacterized protein YggT (Ycf19 family)